MGHSELACGNVEVATETCLLMFSDASNHNSKDEDGNKTQSQAGWILVGAEINVGDEIPDHPK